MLQAYLCRHWKMFKITWVDIAQKFTLIVLLLAIWGIAYAIFGDAVGYKSETVMLGVN